MLTGSTIWATLALTACDCGGGTPASAPALVVTLADGAQTTEAATQATFTVQLDRRPSADVVVPVASSDVTEATITTSSLVFTRDNWNAPQQVVVTGVDDDVADGTQAYDILLGPSTSSSAKFAGLSAQVALQNVDDESAGMTLTPVLGDVSETGTTTTFTAVLHSQPTADVVVAFASDDEGEGTISPSARTFTSTNWNAPQTLTITGVDDDLLDGTQAFSVAVTSITSADSSYHTLALPPAVSVNNLDDDTAGVLVAVVTAASAESGAAAEFSLALQAQPAGDVTITLASSDGGEGQITSSVALVFTSANYAIPQTVTVAGVDDDLADGDQPYTITGVVTSSVDTDYAALDDVVVALANQDDDTAGIDVSPASGHTAEDGTPATFSVVLSSEPTADVTITFDTDDVGEGIPSTTTLTFTAADWNVAQTVDVTGYDDDVDDGDQPYQIVFADVASADGAYAALLPANVAMVNDDDDDAGLVLTPLTGHTAEDGTFATFTVALSSEPTADVTVTFDTDDAGEGTTDLVSLVFTSADWDVPQTVTVTGQDDDIDDGDQLYHVAFDPTTSADPKYDGVLVTDVSVTNDDDDTAGISVSAISRATSEALQTATFTVVLLAEPTADVVLTFASNDPSEGVTDIGTLTFTSADWNVPQSVVVTGVDDMIVDGDVVYGVAFDPATSADLAFDGLVADTVAVTNLDDGEICYCSYAGDDFESGTASGFTELQQTLAVTNATAANGTTTSITVTGGASNHLLGVVRQAPSCQTTRMSVWVKPQAGTTSAHNYIVLGDDSVTATNAILFFYALGSSNAFRFVSSSSLTVPYTPDVWVRLVVDFDWATSTLDASIGGVPVAQDFPFRGAGITSLTRIHFYNFNSAVGSYDELEFETTCP